MPWKFEKLWSTEYQYKTMLNKYKWNEAGNILIRPRTFLIPIFSLALKGSKNTCKGKDSYRQTRYWEKSCGCFTEAPVDLLFVPHEVGTIIVLTISLYRQGYSYTERGIYSMNRFWQVAEHIWIQTKLALKEGRSILSSSVRTEMVGTY